MSDLWPWKYTATDIADLFDENDEKLWRQHDEWLIQAVNQGDARPVFMFARWYGEQFNSMPQRLNSAMVSSVFDLFRLGNDFDVDSNWGVAKGVFLNLSRVVMVVDPAASALGIAGRFEGLLATSGLKNIVKSAAGEVAEGPCSFVAVNNVLSYLHGRSVQLFARVEQIIEVRGANTGIGLKKLLASERVQAELAKYGVTWTRLGSMNSIDDVMRAARTALGPITFGIAYERDGAIVKHALTVVKDSFGNVRILDYVNDTVEAFRGYASIAEMAALKPALGTGLVNAVLEIKAPVIEFSSRYLKLLEFTDGSFGFGLPIAMGLKWNHGATADDKLFEIGRSVWRFLKKKLGDKAPISKTPGNLPKQLATPATIPSTPDAGGKALGVSPTTPEAAAAPRIDWLTGIQYRLKYLGYYKGAVHGKDDLASQNAILAFQKDWFTDPTQWDKIPGPITQGMLYSMLGW